MIELKMTSKWFFFRCHVAGTLYNIIKSALRKSYSKFSPNWLRSILLWRGGQADASQQRGCVFKSNHGALHPQVDQLAENRIFL